jgi:Tfp pilus assembly protein PilX
MRVRQLRQLLGGQRGVALPMAMLALVLLSALIIAFSMLAASEPVLANNQLQVAQARAVAESGVERAIWALNNPADANGIPNPLVTPAAPYDGTTTTAVMQNGVQIGVFTVSVTNGSVANERVIVATGWVPSNTASNRVKQRIQVSVLQFLFSGFPPPAALTVRGEINASGNTLIDSRSDTSCGNKAGSYSQGFTTVGGSAAVYGADGNNAQNQSTDVVQNVPDANFDAWTLKNADLNQLKKIAQANGTYYQGTVTFNSGNQLPNGVVFIDTVSGNNIDVNGANTTDPSDFASVTVHGGAPSSADGIFHGLLIVNGSLAISGDFQMYGFAYATNDFTYTGTGTGQIVGAVVSRNIRDTSSTSIDTNTGGNASIIYNCNYAKTGGGQSNPGFLPEKGTYKEISG